MKVALSAAKGRWAERLRSDHEKPCMAGREYGFYFEGKGLTGCHLKMGVGKTCLFLRSKLVQCSGWIG